TILLEIDTIDRFDTRQQFCSYARLCGAVQQSAGQRTGLGNRKAGNAWLKWAFSEAAVLCAQKDERIAGLLVCSIPPPTTCREYPQPGSREEVFPSAEARPLAAD